MDRLDQFALSLKAASQEIRFNIAVDDSPDDVFDKLVRICPQCVGKKTETLARIKQELENKLKMTEMKPQLEAAIRYFLENSFGSNSQSHRFTLSNPNSSVLMHTISEEDKQEEQASRSPLCSRSINQAANRLPISLDMPSSSKKRSVQIAPTQEQPIAKQKKKASMPTYIQRDRSPKRNKCQNKSVTAASNSKKKNVNPDVVKACELIMKKSSQNDMKLMAREFLKEKGFLQEEKQPSHTHKKRFALSEESQIKDIEAKTDSKQVAPVISEPFPNTRQVRPQRPVKEVNCSLRSQNYKNSSKYRYLQSSLINETLNNLSKEYEYPSVLNTSQNKGKKYNYLLE